MAEQLGSGRLLSVNVAEMRLLMLNGQPVRTGIFKLPVAGRTAVGIEGLEGDRQADRTVHGGPDKAVYSYGSEDYEWWSSELDRDWEPGLFGENLTAEGLDPSHATIGERWRIGSTLLEVSEPRQPCSKLAAKMEDPRFVRRFARALRLGAYLRVIEPGELGPGDTVEVAERPDHDVTVEMLGRIAFGQRDLAPHALQASALSAGWRGYLEELAERAG